MQETTSIFSTAHTEKSKFYDQSVYILEGASFVRYVLPHHFVCSDDAVVMIIIMGVTKRIFFGVK